MRRGKKEGEIFTDLIRISVCFLYIDANGMNEIKDLY